MHARTPPSQVDDEYYKHLHELDQKLTFMFNDKVACSSEATRALQVALEKLRIKALIKMLFLGAVSASCHGQTIYVEK
jgi:hypothetical protein